MRLLTTFGALCAYLCLCVSIPVRSPRTKMTVQSHPMLAALFNTADTVHQIELSNREFGTGKARNMVGRGIGAMKKKPINSGKKSIELLPIVAPGLKPIRGTKEIFKGKYFIWVRIHQPFSRTFFVFFPNICKFECNTSDWLNRTV